MRIPCNACNEDGWILIVVAKRDEILEIECPHCKGKGYIESK